MGFFSTAQEDLFDADNGADESTSRGDEQPAASTSSRPPMQQAIGFEKRRTKRNYVPDQDVSLAVPEEGPRLNGRPRVLPFAPS